MTMDREVKKRWLEALRSGDYKQTDHWLQKGDCNCCLGVLSKIEGVPFTVEDHPEGYTYGNFDFGDRTDITYVPDGFKGLGYSTIRVLASKNDSGMTFEQIADYIEENL